MDWFERNFGKVWVGAFITFIVIDLAILGVGIWAVINLVNWVAAQ